MAYKKQIEEQITFITNDRKRMYGRVKRCRDEQLKENYQKDIQSYSKELSELKAELKLCENIEKRSHDIQEKVNRVEQLENNQSVHSTNEKQLY